MKGEIYTRLEISHLRVLEAKTRYKLFLIVLNITIQGIWDRIRHTRPVQFFSTQFFIPKKMDYQWYTFHKKHVILNSNLFSRAQRKFEHMKKMVGYH